MGSKGLQKRHSPYKASYYFDHQLNRHLSPGGADFVDSCGELVTGSEVQRFPN